MQVFEQPISEYIWDLKYRYKQDNKVIDQTIADTWKRVAVAAAAPEKLDQKRYWTKAFYSILEGFQFLPGGRILAGAGVAQDVTLFNCFVMKIKDDSITGIFDALKEGAMTLQKGGGVGYDFSVIRPQGYTCQTTQSIASGPISFMRVWDAMSATMLSSGVRRGAMMANLRCDHPDIEKFVHVKANKNELRQFNLSVVVTDAFMNAMTCDEPWELTFPRYDSKKVSAKKIWDQIIRAAYDFAEPGVIFEDTINKLNPLYYCEYIHATNPCGEIPLPSYGACNLGSINLTQFIEQPFTQNAKVNWHKLEQVTTVATRLLDNVVDISRYPLKLQQEMSYNTRRMGLGFTGLANCFVMLGIKYGSSESLELARTLAQTICYTTWMSSSQLAKEKGSFPFYNQKYLEGEFVNILPLEIRNEIKKSGIRNSHHNAIAPTGSISLLANNVSGGLEPIFSKIYNRNVTSQENEIEKFTVEDYSYHLFQTIKPNALPPAWIDVNSLTPEDHLNMQAVVQPYIDNAISKTINLPENFPFAKLTEVYTTAFHLGLKGCTIFRPNPITGSILSVDQCNFCYD